jgi:signal transduction histidine kinase
MNNPEELALLINLGMLFSLVMGIGMIFLADKNRQIKALGEQLLKDEIERQENDKLAITVSTQEAERSKIARKLHDELGALLSMAQKNLQLLEDESQLSPQQSLTVSNASNLIQQSIEEIRTISNDLMPFYLQKFGLAKGLERMGQQKTNVLSEDFKFESNLPTKLVIQEETMTHFFYIASELMTNLMKHSQPKKVKMTLDYQAPYIQLEIQHDGIALSESDYEVLHKKTTGLGLENIRYRCDQISANLSFKRHANKGKIHLVTALNFA